MNKSNLTQHPCEGKCTDFEESRCNHCLILEPACDCGSDQLVSRTATGFICLDCSSDSGNLIDGFIHSGGFDAAFQSAFDTEDILNG